MSELLEQDVARAMRSLSRRDQVLRQLIRELGPCRLYDDHEGRDVFQALMRAIVGQQLSGKAARTIHARVLDLFKRCDHPSPRQLLRKGDDALRGAGLSRNKVLAIKDLARKVLDGSVSDMDGMQAMSDEAVVEQLVQVRGIGRWTAEMLLISELTRLDIMPATDLGVRKGYMLAFGETELPDPDELLAISERWRPYRSIVSWYFWRATDTTPPAVTGDD